MTAAKPQAKKGPLARLPRGLRDIAAGELKATRDMLAKIHAVYERYGYEAIETPAIEFTDALGKFLPDTDRPNAGVFSFQDDDDQWMSLRYDLTAPLARYVAENYQDLPKPFRRYASGPVWRNEKPGPGRFRQFMQCDADTVGTDSIAADAEAAMLMADVMEEVGIARGDYVIRVNNRKLLDGLLDLIGLAADDATKRTGVLRSLDKMDKFPWADVALLLGPKGRRDASGDFTPGVGLDEKQIATIKRFLDHAQALATTIYPKAYAARDNSAARDAEYAKALAGMAELGASKGLTDGLTELEGMHRLFSSAGYGEDRIKIDPSVIRGLEYYTGPVFEAELTFEIKNEDGQPIRFGSVGGGGRYDGLVARFGGQQVPATGFSIGVSRLQAALTALGKLKSAEGAGPVVVCVMDKAEIATYQQMTQHLRQAGVRAEMYLGTAGMGAQLKYADKRNAPVVIIQGSQERADGVIQIKDLIEGAKMAKIITDPKE
ncbi:MAG: hypothetical protein RL291_1329, partial [Pseudomonadota bacterium]